MKKAGEIGSSIPKVDGSKFAKMQSRAFTQYLRKIAQHNCKQTNQIPYSEVSKVESNKGHSTARNLGIGIGIGAGAFLGILLITIAHLD